MLTPVHRVHNLAEYHARREAKRLERERLATAGIAWPPVPFQRVEITGNRLPSDPPGRVLGTVLYRNGSYTYVVPDCIEPDNNYPRECYWDNELSPVFDDPRPGWVPYKFWKAYMAATSDRTKTSDLKLNNGSWAFDCYPKPLVTGNYSFQEIGKPYRLYWPNLVAAVMPSGY